MGEDYRRRRLLDLKCAGFCAGGRKPHKVLPTSLDSFNNIPHPTTHELDCAGLQAQVHLAVACRWTLDQPGVYERMNNAMETRSWNYTLSVGPGGVSKVAAVATQAMLVTAYTANLSVILSSGSRLLLPIESTFEGISTSTVVRDHTCRACGCSC